MTPGIDHLVIGAADLDEGRQYVENLLGVPTSPGGRHPQMGTHNCLLSLGSSTYLEVIAIDPEAPAPSRSRWFGLDNPETTARLAEEPCLLTWVVHGVKTADLAPPLRDDLGPVEIMRRGKLEWRITIPIDGRPPANGALPALIEWSTPDHPAQGLPDQGCRLRGISLHQAQGEAIARVFTDLGIMGLSADASQSKAAGDAPFLVADIQTPRGLRHITSAPRLG